MKFKHVEWDRENTPHCLRHGLSKEAVEDVVVARFHRTFARSTRIANRRMLVGRTRRGRIISVIVLVLDGGVARPISCFPASTYDVQRYRETEKAVMRKTHVKKNPRVTTKPEFRAGQPMPKFRSEAEEAAWWRSFSYGNFMSTGRWTEVEQNLDATSGPRLRSRS